MQFWAATWALGTPLWQQKITRKQRGEPYGRAIRLAGRGGGRDNGLGSAVHIRGGQRAANVAVCGAAEVWHQLEEWVQI